MRGTDVTERTEAEPTLLRVRELTKTFFSTEPPATVLNGIDLDVARGEFLAIMGASGSGKSTLLYAMSGMDRPTSGSVELDDREITSLDDAEISRVRLTQMGFVFQQAHFLQNLSVRDNILLPALKAAEKGDPAPVARFPGLARVQWQRDEQQVQVRYQGKAAIYNNQAKNWTVYTPDVLLATAGGEYAFELGGRELTLRGQIQNLFDTRYWNSGTSTCCYSLSPGQPRTISLDLKISL